ncbi:hypothetical protein AAF712_012533 [Marasmius tenuissimus]|uniref:BZIP domain-containing protein n=1 Tax=Marasmius tenuissimus TaxID=585030 RepID=A0ABR2ZGE7_9AGAR
MNASESPSLSPLSPLSPLSSCSSNSPRLTSSFNNDRQRTPPRPHTLLPSEASPSTTLGSAIFNQQFNHHNISYSQDVRPRVNSSALPQSSKALRHGPPSHNPLDLSSSSRPNNVSLTTQSNPVALQQLANHYGIPSVLPKPPLSKPATISQQPQQSRSTPPLPDFQSQLSNYLSMLAHKPEPNQTSSNIDNTMINNTVEEGQHKDVPAMDKDALQSVVETLMGEFALRQTSDLVLTVALFDDAASPEFRNLPSMDSPAVTSPNSFLTSPFDTPLQQFDTSPLIDFADTYNGTSPLLDTPLFDDFNTSPIDDSPFLDVLNTPVMDAVDGVGMYANGSPLFDDGGVGMYQELEQQVKSNAAQAPWDQLLKISPQTSNLDPSLVYPSPSLQSEQSFSAPSPPKAATPAPASSAPKRKQPTATGTRRNITPESLVPYDAPTQSRRYAMPSATSKKEVPATFARKKRKMMGGAVNVGGSCDDELDDDADLPPLHPDATEKEQIEYKRRQNTLAARKSRKRKLEYQQGLETENDALKREVEAWKCRCELLSGMLKGAGINVDVQDLVDPK